MTEPYHVLVVDDEESIRKLLKKELETEERAIHVARNAAETRRRIHDGDYDLLVLDIKLPDSDGLDLFTECKAKLPDAEVVLITGHGTIDDAVEAMRLGAYDYITKPFKLDRLSLLLDRAYQRVCLQRENRSLRHSQEITGSSQKLVGNSPVIKHLHYLVSRVAPAGVPVLLTGESGVGKDVVARKIHEQSDRAKQPIITKNCAMLQRELVRSELFGHTKGAFTGASEAKEGLLALANKGTLFLDEVGDLPEEVQASLLRVLESQTYRRVGENEERRVDVRFLFATNRNLAKEVEDGRFNEALFHRINVFNIDIPPLRERREDIPLLIEHFLTQMRLGKRKCTIADKTLQFLMRYDWPGNVRELRNVLERSVILAENGVITNQTLPKEVVPAQSGDACAGSPLSLESMERAHIRKVLAMYQGNRQRAAEALGIGRKTLYRKLRKHGLASAD
ncbi:sigma-54-dependent transcriptional regulator [Desulfohalovibrio reitneri]|uniref:sigma-54-dependent transcriptional regulator n=1 Tax=Desulfohalovibrio reitneri TaxID=1307759 RepID=UPI0004A709C2|nr:sigma-54 dependent transcriptional regulator [Desulfohalovibrio reitneri]